MVIGVIAILLSLLIPSLKHARQVAQSLRCTNNLKQMGMACKFYADENDDYFFGVNWIGSPSSTYYYYNVVNGSAQSHCNFNGSNYYLQPYLSNATLYQCPASTIPDLSAGTMKSARGVPGATYVSFANYNFAMRKFGANYIFSDVWDGQSGLDKYANKPIFMDPVQDLTVWGFDASMAEIHGGRENLLPILMSNGEVIQFDRRKYPQVWAYWGTPLFTIITDILRSAN